MKRIKFIGKFKDLIPMGYTFQKLYAMNYRSYKKNRVLIWASHRDVIIKNLCERNSAHVAELIINEKYPTYLEDKVYEVGKIIFLKFKKGEPKCAILNRNTGKVIPYIEFMKANDFNPIYDFCTYTELILNLDILNTIKELHKNKMIEIK